MGLSKWRNKQSYWENVIDLRVWFKIKRPDLGKEIRASLRLSDDLENNGGAQEKASETGKLF